SFEVSAPTPCHWTAASRVDWIHITGGASGNGPGTVTFSVDSGYGVASAGGDRAVEGSNGIVGQVIAAGQSFLVDFGGEGDGCYFALQPDHATFATSGGDSSLFVYAPSGCAWQASSDVPWIHPSTAIHVGDGGVGYHVDANTAWAGSRGSQRTGTFRVGDSTFTVTQESVGCSYALNPTTQPVPAGGGQLSVQMTAASGCTWTAVSDSPWLHVTGGSPGSGNGTIYYYVDYNNSLDPRT